MHVYFVYCGGVVNIICLFTRWGDPLPGTGVRDVLEKTIEFLSARDFRSVIYPSAMKILFQSAYSFKFKTYKSSNSTSLISILQSFFQEELNI